MFRHILIPTYRSELAEHPVINGLTLAKSVGAKVPGMSVEAPSGGVSVPETRGAKRRALAALAKHSEQGTKAAAKVLSQAVDVATRAGVPCDRRKVDPARTPYQAI